MFSHKHIQILHEFFAGIEGVLPLEPVRKVHDLTGIPMRDIHIYALQNGLIPARYERNIGTVGVAGQIKLLQSCALIIGLGGLGGNVIEQLARIGVGKIIATDFDEFDESNLNRQILSSHQALGKSKSKTAQQRVELINSDVTYIGYEKKLDELDDGVFGECDVVFDCLDNVPDRLVLGDRCKRANVTLIHAAIAAWYAQVAIVGPGSGKMKKIYKDQCPTEKHQSPIEKKLGCPVFTAAVAASLMTSQGVKVLIGETIDDEDAIVTVDLLSNEVIKVNSFK